MKVNKLWFADNNIFIETQEHGVLSQSLQWYPLLQKATNKQKENYRISPMGLHWSELDEDMSFESFFYKEEEEEQKSELYKFFKSFPEINVSKLARRMGISQSLMASYICGVKKPSAERLKEIENAVRHLGQELSSVSFQS